MSELIFRWPTRDVETARGGAEYVVCRYRTDSDCPLSDAPSCTLYSWELEQIADGYQLPAAKVAELCIFDFVEQLKKDNVAPEDAGWPLLVQLYDKANETWLQYTVDADFDPRFFVSQPKN